MIILNETEIVHNYKTLIYDITLYNWIYSVKTCRLFSIEVIV